MTTYLKKILVAFGPNIFQFSGLLVGWILVTGHAKPIVGTIIIAAFILRVLTSLM